MTKKLDNAIKLVRQYNKWRRGAGRKYAAPGFPFNTTEVGEALDTLLDAAKTLTKMEVMMFRRIVKDCNNGRTDGTNA